MTSKQRDACRRALSTVRQAFESTRGNGSDMGSGGLVARYGAVGGSGNRVYDRVGDTALRLASCSSQKKKEIAWLDCVLSVHVKLMQTAGKSISRRRCDRTIAYVLWMKVVEGYTLRRIGDEPMPHKNKASRQCIAEYWDKAVEVVGQEAIRRGLL